MSSPAPASQQFSIVRIAGDTGGTASTPPHGPFTAPRMANGRTAAGFDTLAATRALEEAGVAHRQVEAHARITAKAVGADRLATKTDLSGPETRLIKIVFGVTTGQAAVTVALLELPG